MILCVTRFYICLVNISVFAGVDNREMGPWGGNGRTFKIDKGGENCFKNFANCFKPDSFDGFECSLDWQPQCIIGLQSIRRKAIHQDGWQPIAVVPAPTTVTVTTAAWALRDQTFDATTVQSVKANKRLVNHRRRFHLAMLALDPHLLTFFRPSLAVISTLVLTVIINKQPVCYPTVDAVFFYWKMIVVV